MLCMLRRSRSRQSVNMNARAYFSFLPGMSEPSSDTLAVASSASFDINSVHGLDGGSDSHPE